MSESKSTGPKSMAIDLHGYPVRAAKEKVKKTLYQAKLNKVNDITVVTGIGNHINKNGSRGVLFNSLPEWLNDPEFKQYINGDIKQDMGAYEITIKTESEDDNENTAYSKHVESLNEPFKQMNTTQMSKLLQFL